MASPCLGPLQAITLCLPAFGPSVLTPVASLQVVSLSSFDGCLRNLQLDGRPLGPPSGTFGVTPCYEGSLESGVFFSVDGGSIVLGTSQQPGLAPEALGCIPWEVLCPSPHRWCFSCS